MGNCSNISNTQTVSLSSGTITGGFCHTSLQTTYEEFIARTTASLSGNLAGFTAGDDTPASGDQDKLWLKQNASTCAPEGWQWYNGSSTAWEAVPVPDAALSSSLSPIGTIIMYGASAAPTNWLICNGDPQSRTTYATLFDIIGTTYGTGDGSTTFNLPDLRSRMPVGIGDGDAGGTALTDRSLGDTGGEENVTLTASQIPAHNHPINTGADGNAHHGHTAGNVPTGLSGSMSQVGSTYSGSHGVQDNTGGGSAHPNMPPFLAINFLIKAA